MHDHARCRVSFRARAGVCVYVCVFVCLKLEAKHKRTRHPTRRRCRGQPRQAEVLLIFACKLVDH